MKYLLIVFPERNYGKYKWEHRQTKSIFSLGILKGSVDKNQSSSEKKVNASLASGIFFSNFDWGTSLDFSFTGTYGDE